MTRNKLELNVKQCDLIYNALIEYLRVHDEERDITVTEHDDLDELILSIDGEGMRLQAAEKRKAAGLFIYVFYDEAGKKIDDAELHNDGEAWEYTYKTLAPYYPAGVTFKRVED